jgi:hypothetical protein
MCRDLNKLSPPPHGLFYSMLDFFPSPEKSFELLVYAKLLAISFVAQHIADPVSQIKYLDL